jgi:hypothetical protein
LTLLEVKPAQQLVRLVLQGLLAVQREQLEQLAMLGLLE